MAPSDPCAPDINVADVPAVSIAVGDDCGNWVVGFWFLFCWPPFHAGCSHVNTLLHPGQILPTRPRYSPQCQQPTVRPAFGSVVVVGFSKITDLPRITIPRLSSSARAICLMFGGLFTMSASWLVGSNVIIDGRFISPPQTLFSVYGCVQALCKNPCGCHQSTYKSERRAR